LNFPTKKIIPIVLTAILAVAGIYFAFRYTDKTEVENPIALQNGTQNSKEIDSDNDDLPDWEEILRGTDPKNPDTDGDGTSDGEEIALGRNPLVKGPDDKLTSEALSKSENISKISQPQTVTEKFAQDFFEQYLMMKTGGKQLSETDKVALLQSALENLPASPSQIKYTITDVKISALENIETVRAYGNKIGEVVVTNLPPGNTENELVILEQAYENDNPEAIKKLDPIIKSYADILSGLLKIEPPKSASAYHLELVNAIAVIIDSLNGMKMIITDPVKALGFVQNYPQAVNTISDSFKNIRNYLLGKGIIYTQNESGYFLTK
jgi:hypothetical protein